MVGPLVCSPSTTVITVSANASARFRLDAAQGPLHPAAKATLLAALDAGWADPARLYSEGRRAGQLLQTARAVFAEDLGVSAESVSLHPSPADALAVGIAGLRHARRRVGTRLLTSAADQALTLAAADPEAPLPVDRAAKLDVERFSAATGQPGVALAVIAASNGEVGTRQPLDELHRACREAGVPLLVDATAGLGRDATPASWDVLVGGTALVGGPPLGVLAVRPTVRFAVPGPGREAEARRTFTPPWVPLALAAAEAWRQSRPSAESDGEAAFRLVEQIRLAAAAVPDVEVVGDPVDRLPHVVTFSALYADGEALVRAFDRRGIAVASGSACTSSTLEPSHVLAAMGALTHGNVRVVLPLPAVQPDLDTGVASMVATLGEVVAEVRAELGSSDL